MSVRLRLRRTGTVNKPSYRVVAADQRSPRDGKFIEILGHYDPRRDDESLNLERAEYWLSNGAQPSKTVLDLINRARKGALRAITTRNEPVALGDLPAAELKLPKEEKPAPAEAEETVEAAAEAPAEEAAVSEESAPEANEKPAE